MSDRAKNIHLTHSKSRKPDWLIRSWRVLAHVLLAQVWKHWPSPSTPRVSISCSCFWLDRSAFLQTSNVSTMIVKFSFSWENNNDFPHFPDFSTDFSHDSGFRKTYQFPKKYTVRKPFQKHHKASKEESAESALFIATAPRWLTVW